MLKLIFPNPKLKWVAKKYRSGAKYWELGLYENEILNNRIIGQIDFYDENDEKKYVWYAYTFFNNTDCIDWGRCKTLNEAKYCITKSLIKEGVIKDTKSPKKNGQR